MAKTKDLRSAMQELKKNYKQVLKEAVQYATEEAISDAHQKALSCLEEYYANYTPTSYDPRSDSLKFSFVPYHNVKSDSNFVISTVGIEYNADKLDAYAGYAYDASYKYERVDTNWVINNYLDGIHPTTDGISTAGLATYIPIYDDVSPTQKMYKYLTKYKNTFDDNVNAYLAAYLLK